jgi:hypothetical protein
LRGFSGASFRRYTDAKPAGDQRQNSPFAEISHLTRPGTARFTKADRVRGSIYRWTMFFTAAAQRSQPQLSNSLPIGTTCGSAKSSNIVVRILSSEQNYECGISV